jgi:hypothetical protein
MPSVLSIELSENAGKFRTAVSVILWRINTRAGVEGRMRTSPPWPAIGADIDEVIL